MNANPTPPSSRQANANQANLVQSGRIEAEILLQTEAQGADKSISPSEVARALDPEWQKLSSAVRRAAIRLAQAGTIDILRKGKRVDPAGVKGVIRLRLARQGVETGLDDSAGPDANNGPDERRA